MKVFLANPRGFCAGVERAIEIVERAIDKHGAPIYVRHEVVHNQFVVNNLKEKGAVFVDEINQVPEGGVVVFSAHGVSQRVRKDAKSITSTIYDATCPLVTKVHKEVTRRQKQNHQVILVGHAGHPEVEGTLGQSNNINNITLVESIVDVETLDFPSDIDISYTTQTTLSVDDTSEIVQSLQSKFPQIQARQDSVKTIINNSDMLLVLGSKNSSNSNRLREIAEKNKKPAYLIDGAIDIDPAWLKGLDSIGVTAGASAPEILVQEVVSYLLDHGAHEIVEVSGANESVHFPVPNTLRV